jgi:hypothetical protein
MIHVVTPDTVLAGSALSLSSVPRPLLWRGLGVAPRRGFGGALWRRILFEQSLPRYLIALFPFPIAMAIWPDLALPIAQAPLFMFAVIYLVEIRVLAVPREKRAALIEADAAARGLDVLRDRSKRLLTRIAAGRRMSEGRLHLVVEQSELARITPLTLVSVQAEGNPPQILPLTEEERALLRGGLFDADLPETLLQTINLSQNAFLRSTALDPRTISAHARLAAMMPG